MIGGVAMCYRTMREESARDKLNNRLSRRGGVAPNKGVPVDSGDELDDVADFMEQDVTLKKKTQKHHKRTKHHKKMPGLDESGNLNTTGGQSLDSSGGLERDLNEVRLNLDHEVQQMRGIMGLVGTLRTKDKRDTSEERANNLN